MKGISCIHALARIHTIRAKVEDYYSSYFTTEAWEKCYSGIVHPIPFRVYWPHFPPKALLQTPLPRTLPGRPKVHRNRAPDERRPVTTRSLTIRCKLCKQLGHNKRRYPQSPSSSNTGEKRKKKSDISDSQCEPAIHQQTIQVINYLFISSNFVYQICFNTSSA